MPPFARILILSPMLVLAACKSGKRPSVDPESLQTPAGESALRYIIEKCPKRAEAKLAVIMIGDSPPGPPMPAFVERFRDVPGLTFVDHNRIVAAVVNGTSRRFDSQTQEPVLELQISALSEPKDGVQEAVAAWAFKDDAERKRLELKHKPEGGYDVRELETIPVPHRNDDTRRASGK